jgi:hypothetical protein
VAFIADCYGDLLPDRVRDIREYSFATGRVRRLYPYYVTYLASGFTIDPKSNRGLLNDGYGLAERLRWLEPTRLSAPIKLPLDRVGDPAWAPDGSVVALAGARGLTGVSGVGRLDAVWTLYLLDPQTRRLTPLVRGLNEGRRGGWSPDSRFYAVALKNPAGTSGVGVVRLRDKRVVLIRTGSFGEVDWIDEHTVVAIRRGRSGERDRLEILDVTDVMAARRHSTESGSTSS